MYQDRDTYMCKYIHIYVQIYTHICANIYTYMYQDRVCIYICICMYDTLMCMYTYHMILICIYSCQNLKTGYVYVYVYVCTCTYVGMYTVRAALYQEKDVSVSQLYIVLVNFIFGILWSVDDPEDFTYQMPILEMLRIIDRNVQDHQHLANADSLTGKKGC